MMIFLPSVEGSAAIHGQPRAFIAAFTRRINAALLPHAAHSRSRYAVVHETTDRVRFRATTWWTAISVGLNDVELTAGQDGRVRYTIQYWRWAVSVIVYSACLGVVLATVFLVIDIRDYIARNPASQIPGFSMDQNIAVAWGMVVFWGFLFPWMLIPMHKRPLRRLMDRIIAEVDTTTQAPCRDDGTRR